MQIVQTNSSFMFCSNNRWKDKDGNFHYKIKEDFSIRKIKQGDKLVANATALCFEDEPINTQSLQYEDIWVGKQKNSSIEG